jgi:hypothetical protein
MRFGFLHFAIVAAAAAGWAAGCSASAGAGSAGTMGAGGSSTSSVQSSVATGTGPGPSSTGTGSGGGGAGGESADGGPQGCGALECGTFGSGCVKCAASGACAAEYQKCLDDAQCKAYSDCVAPCSDKGLDCQQACATQFPKGVSEYDALTHCVLCGECTAVCMHAPDLCK